MKHSMAPLAEKKLKLAVTRVQIPSLCVYFAFFHQSYRISPRFSVWNVFQCVCRTIQWTRVSALWSVASGFDHFCASLVNFLQNFMAATVIFQTCTKLIDGESFVAKENAVPRAPCVPTMCPKHRTSTYSVLRKVCRGKSLASSKTQLDLFTRAFLGGFHGLFQGNSQEFSKLCWNFSRIFGGIPRNIPQQFPAQFGRIPGISP